MQVYVISGNLILLLRIVAITSLDWSSTRPKLGNKCKDCPEILMMLLNDWSFSPLQAKFGLELI